MNTTKARQGTTSAKKITSEPKATSAKVAKADIPVKVKHKLVRDGFTIPADEYAILENLKTRSTQLARPAKKGELLRAGIAVLAGMSDKAFLSALAQIPNLKTGRPKGVS